MTTQTTEQPKPGDGNAAPATAAPAIPVWITETLADGTRQAEFLKFVRSTYDEDFAKHKEATGQRERSLAGKVAGASAWQKLDETQQTEWLEEIADRDRAVTQAVEQGVPQDLLEDRATAANVRAFSRKYLARHAQAKPAAKEGATDEIEARIAAKVMEKLNAAKGEGATGEQTGLFAEGGRVPRPLQVTKDNIDALWLKGEVPDATYRQFQADGTIPR